MHKTCVYRSYLLYTNVYVFEAGSPHGSEQLVIHAHVNQWHDGSHRHMDMSARLCGPMHGVSFKTIFYLADSY